MHLPRLRSEQLTFAEQPKKVWAKGAAGVAACVVGCAGLVGCSFAEEAPSPATSTAPTSTTSLAPTTSAAPHVNEGQAPVGVGTFRMDGPAAITNATYDSMPYVLPLNPAGPQDTMVRWVEGWGQSPTTAEAGTTYVLGHAWGQAPLVFNPISELATANVNFNAPEVISGVGGVQVSRYPTAVLNGSRITMADASGNAREWIVDGTYLIDKYEAIDDTWLVDEHIPGRIVLIACSTDGSADLGFNVIVHGHLTDERNA
ncbi:sortase [Corynebacterium sp. 76QC2CO]|nr:sortase [Corynebacterium sp. 76QC2CO]